MTRKKKSRKPGLASISTSKDKKAIATPSDKKPKKLKGRKPGSRQADAIKKSKQKVVSQDAKDPRIGSKKPIVLAKSPEISTKKPQVKTSAKPAPIAAIKVVDNAQALEQELYAIEDDQALQDIVAKQEQELALTNDEVDYFNEKMDRYHSLKQQLGWQDDDEVDSSTQDTDDEALWDKLDNNPLSDYE